MSTFLIGLVVVAATVVVIRVALSDPDQPATIRRPTNRDRPRRSPRWPSLPKPAVRPKAPSRPAPPPPVPATSAARLKKPPPPASLLEGPLRVAARLRKSPEPATPIVERRRRRAAPPRATYRPRREPAQAWVRLRSGLALVVLVTFVGVLMAVTMGTGLALAARALRHAVG